MWLVFHDEGTSLHSLMYSAKAPSDQPAATSATACKEQDAAADRQATAAEQDTTAASRQALGMQSGAKQQAAKHARPKDNDVEKSRQASHDHAEESQVASLAFAISKTQCQDASVDFCTSQLTM